MTMKPYHILDCPQLPRIKTEVLLWIEHHRPELLTQSTSLWNHVNSGELIRSCPSLLEFCESLDLKLREVAVTVIRQPQTQVDLHIDELPVIAKINIPILNTEGSVNQWYEIPQWLMDQTPATVNTFGKKYYTFRNVDLSQLKLLGEIELTVPVVFNSQIAHNIVMKENAPLPRVVLSCTFFKEPIDYLKII